jgi:sugar O-acyltransferase (sialic acid O-acetyltransferase NeuD family)
MKDIVLLGAGGHCISVIDVIEQENKYNIIGVLDPDKNDNILGYPILGDDSLIDYYIKTDVLFAITVGQIKSSKIKRNIAYQIPKERCPSLISPYAYVSRHSSIGNGNHIMHNSVLNAGSSLGSFNIINTLANIEHGVQIGDFNHISTAAMINGDCKIGSRNFVGSNATISNGIYIGDDKLIGAGLFVKHNSH